METKARLQQPLIATFSSATSAAHSPARTAQKGGIGFLLGALDHYPADIRKCALRSKGPTLAVFAWYFLGRGYFRESGARTFVRSSKNRSSGLRLCHLF